MRERLTPEAVEAAMDEYDQIDAEGFKAKYGFGSPRDYWVIRPSNGKAYPAKAIAGVAHGYLPDGLPLVAAQFSGGEGDQGANTMLRRIGYEVVDSPVSATPDSTSIADRIRQYLTSEIVDPARRRGDARVEVVSGDVHRALGLHDAMPNICQVLDGRIFAEAAQVRLADRQGPAASSTVRYTFELLPLVSALNKDALQKLKKHFEDLHPDLTTFAGCQSFNSTEGEYKRALVTRAAEMVGNPEGIDNAALGAALLDLVGNKTELFSNLIDWRAMKLVEKVCDAQPGLVEQALGRMVRDGAGSDEVITFVETVWPDFVAASPNSKPYAESRMVPTMVAALINPAEMLGIRSSPTNHAHKRLYGEYAFGWNELNREELDKVLVMGRQIFAVMRDEWGWEPRDLWDVQGFIWETCQKKAEHVEPTQVWCLASNNQGTDDLPSYLESGQWSLGSDPNASRYHKAIDEIVVGDRIILRDYLGGQTQAPIPTNGRAFSKMRIRATGIVTAEADAANSVAVEWSVLDPERDWYFYTNPRPVWKLPADSPFAQMLIQFAFEGADQDFEAFLNDPYWQRLLAEDENPKEPAVPTNLILYGPPGTGKTYATAREAVALCDGSADYGDDEEGRAALMARYGELQRDKRIGFVTFHQNFSYEDFVEGLRPKTRSDDVEAAEAGFSLEPQDGVFKQIAVKAQTVTVQGENIGQDVSVDLSRASFFKLSLGESGNAAYNYVFDNSIAEDCAIFGFRDIDWGEEEFDDKDVILQTLQQRFPDETFTAMSGPVRSTHYFRNLMQVGDIVIAALGTQKFRAIGVVEGDYYYQPKADGRYSHRRKVKWLWVDPDGRDIAEIYSSKLQMNTIYRLKDSELDIAAIARLIASGSQKSQDPQERSEPVPHVLIIDEINRANISKVFGELITLIEPDKRLGMTNALTVTLPYSKRLFGVPANLHIIGTMNTADRSIALLDTALRRRFTFREIAPEPSLLAEASQETGLPLVEVLETINQRIEFLLDREHRLGHAFFMGCETEVDVDAVMRDKVIPLLQEYFFEDWKQIWAVLGDGFIKASTIKPPPGFSGHPDRPSWCVRIPFANNAYAQLLAGKAEDEPESDDGHSGQGELDVET